jgi:hypothetical protein
LPTGTTTSAATAAVPSPPSSTIPFFAYFFLAVSPSPTIIPTTIDTGPTFTQHLLFGDAVTCQIHTHPLITSNIFAHAVAVVVAVVVAAVVVVIFNPTFQMS